MRLIRSSLALAVAVALLRAAVVQAAPVVGTGPQPASMATERALAATHVAAGDPAAAVPLLDRLVSAAPRDPQLRLELARALIRTGQTDRAAYHLRVARGGTGLSGAERASLDGILASLEKGKRHEGWLRFAIVPESNPGQRTSASSVNIGGFDFTLNTGARAAPATGVHFAAGGALLPLIGPGLRLRIGAGIDARVFRASPQNDVTVTAQFGLRGITRRNATWEVYVSARDRRVGNAAYGRATGLHASWSQMIGQNAQLQLRADHEEWRHPGRGWQDGPRQAVSLSWAQALRPDLVVRGTIFAHRTAARAGFEAGQGTGVSVGVQRLFQGGLLVSLDLTHQRGQRDAPDPVFGVVREDRRSSLTARILHRGISLRGFAPALELGVERQKSTLTLNSFRNARVSVGFSREF